jgi:hypothetical protein
VKPSKDTERNNEAKRQMPAAHGMLRLAGRLGMTGLMTVVAVLIAIQFAHVVNDNVVAEREFSSAQSDITALQARERFQLRELRRLRNPEGAIPEIHDKLRLVRPNEAIIFLRPAPATSSPNP